MTNDQLGKAARLRGFAPRRRSQIAPGRPPGRATSEKDAKSFAELLVTQGEQMLVAQDPVACSSRLGPTKKPRGLTPWVSCRSILRERGSWRAAIASHGCLRLGLRHPPAPQTHPRKPEQREAAEDEGAWFGDDGEFAVVIQHGPGHVVVDIDAPTAQGVFVARLVPAEDKVLGPADVAVNGVRPGAVVVPGQEDPAERTAIRFVRGRRRGICSQQRFVVTDLQHKRVGLVRRRGVDARRVGHAGERDHIADQITDWQTADVGAAALQRFSQLGFGRGPRAPVHADARIRAGAVLVVEHRGRAVECHGCAVGRRAGARAR